MAQWDPAVTDWIIRQACRREVSFRSLALSSTSRFGVAAGTGPIEGRSAQTIMFKAAFALDRPEAGV